MYGLGAGKTVTLKGFFSAIKFNNLELYYTEKYMKKDSPYDHGSQCFFFVCIFFKRL